MARIKTRHVGIYYRLAKSRPLINGRPDCCYDICYRLRDKLVWEKVGWKSEGFTIKDALGLRAQRIKNRWDLKFAAMPDGLTVDAAWQEYARLKLPTLKNPRGVQGCYTCHIQPLFGKRYLATLTDQDIENLKIKLMRTAKPNGECLKASTVRKILRDFQCFLNKIREWKLPGSEHTPSNASFRVRGADSQRERYLTPPEASRLLDDLQIIDCTLYHVVKIALYTGMRLSEILTLQGQQINLTNGCIEIKGKTGHRSVFIPKELIGDFKRLIPGDPAEYLFKTGKNTPKNSVWLSNKFTDIVNCMGFNTGITDNKLLVVFHTLRHTFCSWLAIKGVPILTIGRLAGHRTIAMTQRYAKLSPDCQRDALDYIEKTLKDK